MNTCNRLIMRNAVEKNRIPGLDRTARLTRTLMPDYSSALAADRQPVTWPNFDRLELRHESRPSVGIAGAHQIKCSHPDNNPDKMSAFRL